MLIRYYKDELYKKEKVSKFGTLYNGLIIPLQKMNTTSLSIIFPLIFLLRRLTFATIAITLFDYPHM